MTNPKPFMRPILFALSFLFILSSCEEQDLSGENPAPQEENIVLNASFVYGNMKLRPDTMYTNELGQSFYIEDVTLVFTNFAMYNTTDTVISDSSAFQVSMDDVEEPLVFLEPGGYSMRYKLRLGMDSLRGAQTTAANLEDQDDDIEPSSILRNDVGGIYHMLIKGRVLDPTDPTDTTGNIELDYRIGSYLSSRNFTSTMLNFSVQRTSQLPVIIQVDIKPILDEFDLAGRPFLETNLDNQVDLALSMQMSDSLKVGLF